MYPKLSAVWAVDDISAIQALQLGTLTTGPYINLTGGQPPYRYLLEAGAPPGLVIDNNALQGNPSQIGEYSVVVTISDVNMAQVTMAALRVAVVDVQVASQGSGSLSTTSSALAISLSFALAFGLLALCGFVYYLRMKRANERREPNEELKAILAEQISQYVGADVPLRTPLECSLQDTRKISTLGSGFFGQVSCDTICPSPLFLIGSFPTILFLFGH